MFVRRVSISAVLGRLAVWGIVVCLWMSGGEAVYGQVAPADGAPEANSAPSIIERYQTARYRMLARQIVQTGARRGVPVHGPAHHATPLDTLGPAAPAVAPSAPPDTLSFAVDDARALRRLERGWFRRTFQDVRWSFLGAGQSFTFFDTTMTRDLRARLQTVYGDPTQTLADFDPRAERDDYVQFEYWMVVNDSIPVKVMDAGGPYDRGLILAVDHRYRDSLKALRHTLLDSLRAAGRSPYVDYYHEPELGRWYRTGYDGDAFFTERIPQYRITPGRRPRLPDAPAASSPRSPRSD